MLDSDGYAELLARRPVLYHRVWGTSATIEESIFEHGLQSVRSGYSGFWTSRRGRTFLKASPHITEPKNPHSLGDDAPWSLFTVATDALERTRIEPDEDCFLTHMFIDHESARAGARETRRHRVPFAPTQWLWEWARYLGLRCPTLAEWADDVELGSDPEATRATIMLNQTFSYSGVVPPSALRLVAHGHGATL